MKKILTLPTWQVFLLLIIPGFLPSASFAGLILIVIWAAFLGCCVYILAESLYQKLPLGHDLKIKRFRFNFFLPLFYITIIFIFFGGGYNIDQNNFKDYGWIITIIIPLHIYVMYCVFYVLWFVAKCIATIENERVVGFDNYAGNFFLLWFWPTGIWWLHPKVRRILAHNLENH